MKRTILLICSLLLLSVPALAGGPPAMLSGNASTLENHAASYFQAASANLGIYTLITPSADMQTLLAASLGTGVGTALTQTPDATGGILTHAGLGSTTQGYDANTMISDGSMSDGHVGYYDIATGKWKDAGVKTPIDAGTATGDILKKTATGVGKADTTGSGTTVVLSTSPTLVTPLSTLSVVDGSANSTNLTAAQVSGTMIINTGQGVNDVALNLPAAAAGYNFIGFVGEAQAAKYWRFARNGSDTMCLDGTCGKTYVTIAAPTQGATVGCVAVQMASTGIKTGAALAIGSTTTAVANGAFTFDAAGAGYAKAADAAGTAPGNDTIPQNKYGAVAFDIGADGTIDAIEASANATGYDSAALAIAGIAAAGAGHARMGTVTAISTDAGGFVFGTTALNAGGTTVAYTSAAAYTKPHVWNCMKSVGTWVTD